MEVVKDGRTKDSWDSGLIAKGTTSKVGTVVMPRGAGFRLQASQYQPQAGSGSSLVPSEIGRC